MQLAKKEWTEKMATIQKHKIRWVWDQNGKLKHDGEYEGELQNGRPHGLGKWKNGFGEWVEGEWKDGQLHGKSVHNFVGGREEHEYRNARVNGKLIQYNDDGTRE